MRTILGFLIVILFLPATAIAGRPALPDGLVARGEGRVVEVIDGDTFVLADGRQVRLVGIMAPKLPLGRDVGPWPWAEEASAGLADLVHDRRVTLWGGTTTTDRHGRVLAHVVRGDDGLWVQGEMLRRGLARVYTFADNRLGATAMYRWERDARTDGRGLWAHPDYAIVPTLDARPAVRSFALVEGRVTNVATVRGRTYLNFDDDWRTDFTIRVERPARRLFDAEDLDLAAFERTLVRVRGWVRWENGPLIEVTHPEQIEWVEQIDDFGSGPTREQKP
ncbi:MAG: thermonuclease family protein [Sphingomonadales bacterium]